MAAVAAVAMTRSMLSIAIDPERRRKLAAQQLRADRRPQHDRRREDERDQEAVAHLADYRLHRHAGAAALPVAVRVISALGGPVIVRTVIGRHQRVAHTP